MNDTTTVTQKVGSHKLPDGKEIVLYGFSMIEWTAVQEAALDYYKRNLVKTWTNNADLLPESMREEEIKRAYRDAGRTTLNDLPRQKMKFPQVGEDGQYLKDEIGQPLWQEEEVDYWNWWSSETLEGKLHCTWLSARKAPGQETWTKKHLSDLFYHVVDSENQIEEAAQKVGRLSQLDPKLKNSSSPQEAGNGLTAKQRRILARQQRQAQTGP